MFKNRYVVLALCAAIIGSVSTVFAQGVSSIYSAMFTNASTRSR